MTRTLDAGEFVSLVCILHVISVYPLFNYRRTMIRSNSRCFLFSLLLAAFLVSCFAHGQSVQDDVSAISEALRIHNFAEALSLSKATLAKRPDDYKIWTLCGLATAGSGDLPQALSAYQHALRLAPTYLPALEGAAQTEFQMGRDEAIPLLLKILAERPGDPTSNAMLGVLEFKNGKCSDAVSYFQKAIGAIASQAGALNEYGSCLAALGRNEKAVNIFSDALELDSTKREARYNLALAQWRAHQAENALATLRPLIDQTSADEDALTLAAEISESNGDTQRGVELLRQAILSNPKDSDAYLQFASLSFDHSSARVGIDVLNAGLTQLPKEPRLYLVRGILFTQIGEFSRAIEDFVAAGQIDPQLSFLDTAEGIVLSQQHKPSEALGKFRQAALAHPNEATAQYLLAEALAEEGKPEGSPEYKEELAAAERAIKLDPMLVAAQDLLSTAYYENGHPDLAIKHSRAALAQDPDDQQAVYHLILALHKTGQEDQVPVLVKQLVILRKQTQADSAAHRRYRLYEVPTAASSSAP